ncbi:MAG: flavodoxin family protein [Candidatus Goldiibacteriota bacterium]|jgi:multimeric flavodoxin WrbA
MNVVNILGSPRVRGNSVKIAGMLIRELEKSGAKTLTYELNKISFRGCQGCMACKKGSDKCVVSDGLTDLFENLNSADITIISSPVYFGELSGQAKMMLDRFFSLLKDDYRTNKNPGRLSPGKNLVFIFTQTNPDEARFEGIQQRYRNIFARFGFEDIHIITAVGLPPDREETPGSDIEEKVRITAEKLLAGIKRS